MQCIDDQMFENPNKKEYNISNAITKMLTTAIEERK